MGFLGVGLGKSVCDAVRGSLVFNCEELDFKSAPKGTILELFSATSWQL